MSCVSCNLKKYSMLLNFPWRLTAFGQWHMLKASRTKTTHFRHDGEEYFRGGMYWSVE